MPRRVTNIKTSFGARVRQLRTERGLTQEEFADLVGLDRTYISGIERGVRNVGLLNIERIAKGLGVALHDLF